jgi:hypothetical protein
LITAFQSADFIRHQQSVACDARVVDQHIDATTALQHRFDQCVHGVFIGHVGLKGIGLLSHALDLLHHGFGRIRGAGVIHHHFRAAFSQGQSHGTPDPPAGTGHEGGLTIEGPG